MRAAWGVALLLLGLLGRLHGLEEGCARWAVSSDIEVCCKECKEGNYMVSECGPDPRKLCQPCKEDSYVTAPGTSCRSCKQCSGLQTLKRPCTSSSDTVCDCRPGYHCGDAQCSYCYQGCAKGQEPAGNRTCRPCPHGTFNDLTHSKCVPWSTKCPEPEQQIAQQGTAERDIVCDYAPAGKNGHAVWVMVVLLFLCFAFFTIILASVTFILIRWTKKKKNKRMTTTREPKREKPVTVSFEVRQLVEQEMSCCFPQQEQGSSQESVASIDSKVELLCA